jgi:hypothetical protein
MIHGKAKLFRQGSMDCNDWNSGELGELPNKRERLLLKVQLL